MPDDEAVDVDSSEESEVTEESPKPKRKKAKVTKMKKKTAKAATKNGNGLRGRKLYSLSAKVKLDDFDPATHAGAVVHALKKLGEGASGEVIEHVQKTGKLKDSSMEIANAVRFQLWDLSSRKGLLKTRAKPTAKAA
jgi:hypothetical protein